MKIYVLRHGETEYNRKLICQGTAIDAPLNSSGRKQVQNTAQALKDKGITFDYVYTSPLIRALESAQIIANKLNYTSPLYQDDRLVEKSYGIFEGKSIAYFKKMEEEGINISSYTESEETILARIFDFYKYILCKHQSNDTILVVCHSHIVKTFKRISNSIPDGVAHTFINNASATVFEINDNKLVEIEYIDANEIRNNYDKLYEKK